ncbi:CD320 antigen, partial [Sceloporus undulatus]|uniref:CD320 antigen n=1 Tax=Sceloporus undulatus TaxID=8520 RepID=UPI001C4B1135
LLPFSCSLVAESFQCTLGDFWCVDGGHVPLCKRCDRVSDCGDDSDEEGCEAGNIQCGPRGRLCGPKGPCLPLERFCDGHKDCPDGSDEAGKACGDSHTKPLVKCRKDEFRCAPDADCYPLAFICDRHSDCPDKRDEVGCVFEVPSSPETPETTQPGHLSLDIICLTMFCTKSRKEEGRRFQNGGTVFAFLPFSTPGHSKI